MKLFDSIVNNNAGGNDIGGRAGGGIFNAGTMMLYDSDVSDNSAIFPSGLTGAGGGIFNSVDATLVLRSSTVTGNRSRSGGGISNGGSLSLYDTTISGNTGLGTAIGYEPAGEGGGILNSPDATVVLRSSTVTGIAPAWAAASATEARRASMTRRSPVTPRSVRCWVSTLRKCSVTNRLVAASTTSVR